MTLFKIKIIFSIKMITNKTKLVKYFPYYSCIGPKDDPFTACFGCTPNTRSEETVFDADYNQEFGNIDRQVRERFRRTKRSRRVICSRLRTNCKIRIDKAIELRRRSYMRALEFVQSEEYLDQEDLDILKFYFT